MQNSDSNNPAKTTGPQQPTYPQSQPYPGVAPPLFNMEPPPPYSMQPPPGPGFIHVQQPGNQTFGTNPTPTTTHVITVQPISLGLSPNPVQMTCPNCNATTLTEISAVPGLLTYLAAGTLFLCGCWAGCCLIPCCIPDCLDIDHRCSNCKTNVGRYRRI
ncbi:hypothetical protein DERP_010428 [Dermatophagoides pteronyssinus]|uniref:Lipopolysaccharide-induced tumor necrosis factor-alpha factor homolog n=2 Tax=Dermatophagoides pteronyssinus TaxID=6956 RepID=A0A6P6YF73_DERPT|nr:lipopolysaccharide-induced tumor necrosis factor-alpha factor homolog [Dermatophagoides pteronyssinus]KAH9417614.1 hypothetical protein DERP_010428 [Dermatophagoides pteronyssinus]